MKIDSSGLTSRQINEKIQNSQDDCHLINCQGQRFIGAGMKEKTIKIDGTAGNGLGCYLDGATIITYSNTQEAVGNTMNDGKIVIYGNTGDGTGYSMRGGKIFIKENAGFRTGIHMKEYNNKVPTIIIGGTAGSFLGEYQAGGIIIVLSLNQETPFGDYSFTGMHGGKAYIRGHLDVNCFDSNIAITEATPADMDYIKDDLIEFCSLFNFDANEILYSKYTLITPANNKQHKTLYVSN